MSRRRQPLWIGSLVAVLAVLAVGEAGCDRGGGSASTDGGDAIGVRECDDYLKKWQDCYKDPASKAAARPALDQMVAAWKKEAAAPANRVAVAASCKMALDDFPSAACK
jgi:hypothetical protein